MSFFHTFKDSVYNPAFYSGQASAPAKHAWGYFFKLILLAACVITIWATFKVILPFGKVFSAASLDTVVSSFPQELRVTIQNGQASTNVKEPYAIAFPSKWAHQTAASAPVSKNLVVIDTATPFTPEAFAADDTYVLLTKEYLVNKDNNGKLSVQSLSSFGTTTIDRAQVASWAGKVSPFLGFVVPVIIVGAFVGSFVAMTVVNLFTLLILSLVVWIVEKIRKVSLSYGQIYKLGLYAVTLPTAVSVLATAFGLHSPWYVQTVIYLALIFANLKLFTPAPEVQ